MTQTPTACKNCGATATGNFCEQCGQKTDIHKITFSHLLHEFFHALTHADKGFLFLIKELIFRPGHVAAEYLDGKRKKYFNPLSFLVIASAIWALVVSKTGYFESIGSGMKRDNQGMPEELAFYFSESTKIIVAYGKVISLIITVPLLSFLTWIFFRKGKHSFAENLVLQALLVGESHLALALIFVPLFLIFGNASINNDVFQFIFFAYQAVAYRQLFRNHVAWTILKTIAIFLLFIVLFWLPIFGFVFLKTQLFH